MFWTLGQTKLSPMKYTLALFAKDGGARRCFSVGTSNLATLSEARSAAWIKAELPRAQAHSVLIEAEDGSKENWVRDGSNWKNLDGP